MAKPQLNQVIAVEKGIKGRAASTITKSYQRLQKGGLTEGLVRKFTPKDEDGEQLPTEKKNVQVVVEDELTEVVAAKSEHFDVVARKDWANTEARADVVVEGNVVLSDVPVTYLLSLEKELEDWRTYVSKLPTLDTSVVWASEDGGISRSEPVLKNRTKKVQKPIVLYDATEEHPAQTNLITEDVVVGQWTETSLSGAISVRRQKELLTRANKMLDAVKEARVRGNTHEVKDVSVSGQIFGYLLNKQSSRQAETNHETDMTENFVLVGSNPTRRISVGGEMANARLQ